MFAGIGLWRKQRTEWGLISARAKCEEAAAGEHTPEVCFLLGCSNEERDVTVVSFLLPNLQRWMFKDVAVHHGNRADETPFGGEIS